MCPSAAKKSVCFLNLIKHNINPLKLKIMSFTGNEGSYITLTQGTAWTGNYRSANPNATKAHFLGKSKLSEILAQTGCVGLRMYYAIDDTGAKELVIVGVASNGCDITTGLILDRSLPCPSYCDSTSALNGGNGL